MKIQDLHIMVTGGAGFIGSHIVETLLDEGAQVTVYDNFSTGLKDNLKHVQDKITVIKGDILDTKKLEQAMKGIDVVSHQAAQLEIFLSIDDPCRDLNINTIGTLNVLRAAEKNGVKKVLNASSACVYGQTKHACSEEQNIHPNWDYGVSKLAAEKYGHIYNDYHDLPVVSFRYGIVYGEREWFRRVMTIFIKRTIVGQPLVVFGDGSQIRDFIHVDDVVRLHNLCITSNRTNGEVFNVGTGIGTSIVDLAHTVALISDKNPDVLFEEISQGAFSSLVPDKRRNTQELQTMLLAIDKATSVLGWRPVVTLEEGIQREMNWAQDNLSRWQKIIYS